MEGGQIKINGNAEILSARARSGYKNGMTAEIIISPEITGAPYRVIICAVAWFWLKGNAGAYMLVHGMISGTLHGSVWGWLNIWVYADETGHKYCLPKMAAAWYYRPISNVVDPTPGAFLPTDVCVVLKNWTANLPRF